MTATVHLVKHPTEEDWMLCKQITLGTVGKTSEIPPTSEWKHKILKARHSPIRTLEWCFLLEDIPYWVSVHLCRHVHAIPFVKTQRNDRQGKYDRDAARQDTPVSMYWYMNSEELMTIANKRLCSQAAKETREIVQTMCKLAVEECPEMEDLLVPACEYNGFCHEMFPCARGKENENDS